MVSLQRSKKLLGGAVIVFLAGALVTALLVFDPPVVREIESRTWDWRVQRVAHPESADPNIKLILVDQASLDFFEREYALTWQLPRNAYAHIIAFLTAAGARGVAFDMLFTESSAQAVETDREFADAAGGPLPVISALSLESYDKYVPQTKIDLLKAKQGTRTGLPRWDELYGKESNPEFRSATLPIPELMEKTRALGSVYASPDSDGVYRHHLPTASFRGTRILSLPFALYDETVEEKHSVRDSLDPHGRLTVRLHGGAPGTKRPYRSVAFAEVMQAEADRSEGRTPRLSPDTFRGAWVFVGVTAPGLFDIRPTSVNPRGNGVEFLAAAFDNLLHDDFVRVLPVSTSIVLALAGVILTTVASLVGTARDHLMVFLLLALAVCGGALLAASHGIWVPLIAPIMSMTLAAFLGLALQFQLEGRQNRFLREAFQHYVSPSLVKRIVENPAQLSLGGEKRALTIFFSDIVGFTSISERLEPTALVELLNDYLTVLTDIIQAGGGTVDKYVGDAVVAFWSAPLLIRHHELCALETAIRCQQALHERLEHYHEKYGTTILTRIGLHSAVVTVGNFGSRTRFNYTVIGDGANLASRLEGANKMFGTEILFSETIEQAVSRRGADLIRYRRVGAVRVLGREQPVTVFEPQISEQQVVFTEEFLPRYTEALELFESGQLEAAAEAFEPLRIDHVSARYLARIQNLLVNPSEEPFDPVWILLEK